MEKSVGMSLFILRIYGEIFMSLNKLALILLIFSMFSACDSQKETSVAQDTEKQTYKSGGVVKNIDADAGKITIDHEDIPGYMSAMEMSEPVSDKKMLEAVKIGDKVEFEIERTGAEVVFTKLNKIGEIAVLSGSEIYKTNCAECHGAKGEGAEKGISFLKGHALHHSEAEFIEQVKNGEKDEMPAFKDKLSEEEIAAVVKFVRTEIQKTPADKKAESHSH